MSSIQAAPVLERGVIRPTRRWVWPAILFLAAFVVYGVTISHSNLSMDVWSANYGSWHLVTAGNPWLDGTHIPLLDDNPLRNEWMMRAANGHIVIERSPGVIAAGLPAYWLVHSSTFTTVPAAITAAALTAGSVTLFFLTVRTRLTDRNALAAALAFGFTTPVWSVAANGMWPHTLTVLGICGMAWAASTERWWLVGVFGGITLWGRLHAAVIVAVLGLFVGSRRRSWALVLRVAVTSGAFVVAMSFWTRWMYGMWNPTASYDTGPFAEYAAKHPFDIVNQLGFWVSPGRGILVWTPVVLLLMPALVRSWRDLPDWSRSLVWGGLAYTVLEGVLNRFSGGDVFYGYRLGLEMLACAAPALAFSAPALGRVGRTLLGPVLAVQLYAITVGAVTDGHMLSESVLWHANAFISFEAVTGVAGWVMVVLVAGAGWVVGRAWNRPAQHDGGLAPTP